jgi:hypothetical protein
MMKNRASDMAMRIWFQAFGASAAARAYPLLVQTDIEKIAAANYPNPDKPAFCANYAAANGVFLFENALSQREYWRNISRW